MEKCTKIHKKESERFLEKFDQRGYNECWPWVASKNNGGYGTFRLWNCKTDMAHRYMKRILGYDIDEKIVAHICDNPSCVNPLHLFVGTQKDNIYDADSKGRMIRNRH